ncbi:MAG: hypothetical protein HS130_09960 [Deltaproteobacteria bacterium]|nr:hypothetical protein [Deltaproteobacteria bacterium]
MTKKARFDGYGKLLGPLEQEIMEFLWKSGEASGRRSIQGFSRQVASRPS